MRPGVEIVRVMNVRGREGGGGGLLLSFAPIFLKPRVFWPFLCEIGIQSAESHRVRKAGRSMEIQKTSRKS